MKLRVRRLGGTSSYIIILSVLKDGLPKTFSLLTRESLSVDKAEESIAESQNEELKHFTLIQFIVERMENIGSLIINWVIL